jgi:hypothetical protein
LSTLERLDELLAQRAVRLALRQVVNEVRGFADDGGPYCGESDRSQEIEEVASRDAGVLVIDRYRQDPATSANVLASNMVISVLETPTTTNGTAPAWHVIRSTAPADAVDAAWPVLPRGRPRLPFSIGLTVPAIAGRSFLSFPKWRRAGNCWSIFVVAARAALSS